MNTAGLRKECREIYPNRQLLQLAFAQGIPIAFGSDFPVEEVNPLLGLDAAVNRANWYPEQKLTLDEAVAGFTTGALFAVGEEAQAGKRADVTIFNGRLEPATLKDREVLMTVVGGEVVYERPGLEASKR